MPITNVSYNVKPTVLPEKKSRFPSCGCFGGNDIDERVDTTVVELLKRQEKRMNNYVKVRSYDPSLHVLKRQLDTFRLIKTARQEFGETFPSCELRGR